MGETLGFPPQTRGFKGRCPLPQRGTFGWKTSSLAEANNFSEKLNTADYPCNGY